MSTQAIKGRLPGHGVAVASTTNWLSLQWKGLLSRKKQFLFGGITLAAFGLGGFYFWGNQSSAAQYMTARVERGNLRNTVTATGTLQAVTTVQVGSQASGTIAALYVDFNSVVKKGQVVAQLDPSVAQAQVEQSRANLAQSQASLRQAQAAVVNARAGVTDAQARALAAKSTVQNNSAGVTSAQANLAVMKAQMDDAASFLRQQQSLVQAGVIAQRDVEVAETSYKSAEARYKQAQAQVSQAMLSEQSSSSAGLAQSGAQVEQSQAQVQQAQAQVQQAQAQVQQADAALKLAEVNLTHTTIASPIDGVVVSRDVNVGQTVAASLSAPTLFTIANDLTQMQVIANIDQADIGLVEQAKSVNFTVDAFPGKGFDGKIQQMRLNPQTVQNVVTYNVVIDVSNPEQKLKPGMTANLAITIDERSNVLKIPNSALRFSPQDSAAQTNNSAGGTTGRVRSQGAATPATNANSAAGSNKATDSDAKNVDGKQGTGSGRNFASSTSPVLEGQTRAVWVMGQDGKPQSRRIKIGLTDGTSTEVVEGSLQEGELVITGQTVSAANKPAASTTAAPGFGGSAPRTGAGGGGGGRRN